MIDLHLHTTASDGRLAPAELVEAASAAGITVMSVTDHDTVAGLAHVRASLGATGLELVDGIEITAVHEGKDVHILGYFIDPSDPELDGFLRAQRTSRVERVREIGARLAAIGRPIDVERIIKSAALRPGRAVGRPDVGRALVRAGHAASMHEAFERFIGAGKPGFVARVGRPPGDVVEVIQRAGGLASMAHPGLTRLPDVMAMLVDRGLDAIEVFHPDHPPDTRVELEQFATVRRLLMTGGSDFHGDDGRGRVLGGLSVPEPAFERLRGAADHRRRERTRGRPAASAPGTTPE